MESLEPRYESLSEAVEYLLQRGYTHEFQYECGTVYCRTYGTVESIEPEDLVITDVYRFEGITDPTDSSVVYALESRNGKKGMLIDAYGAYADEYKSEFLSRIPMKKPL